MVRLICVTGPEASAIRLVGPGAHLMLSATEYLEEVCDFALSGLDCGEDDDAVRKAHFVAIPECDEEISRRLASGPAPISRETVRDAVDKVVRERLCPTYWIDRLLYHAEIDAKKSGLDTVVVYDAWNPTDVSEMASRGALLLKDT